MIEYPVSANKSYDKSEERVKLSSDPSKGDALNNVLELEPAEMSDRGDITCSAFNTATTIRDAMKTSTYIRVKGSSRFCIVERNQF